MISLIDKIKSKYFKILSYKYWEFWAAEIFYIPVIFYYIYFCFKYKLFPNAISYVNPCFPFGGMSFDSKFKMINKFFHYPEFTTKTILINQENRDLEKIYKLLNEMEINFPFVAKPDKAHRGNGFKIIRNEIELQTYLEICNRDFLIQEYINYPYEYGIFYVRIPGEFGEIQSITRKVLPEVIGDGKSTLSELIFKDKRAKYLAEVYLNKNVERLQFILSKDDKFRLCNAGNHCQGAIFEDGFEDIQNETRRKLKEICSSIKGFDFGRMDIKFKDLDSLKNGKNFKILEVNGSEAEMTHIYDRRYSLLEAYHTLFVQWDLLFKIAKLNKENGFKGHSSIKILFEYFKFFFFENSKIKGD